MARGWESKAVELQQEEASGRVERQRTAALSLAERQRKERHRSLELARACTLAALETATLPARRQMLVQALEALEEQMTLVSGNGMSEVED
jgi:hypothetical protein